MFELKSISHDGIPKALARAERYRLLNEPRDAESICRDVLRADPENQDAVRMMLLAITDQFGRDPCVNIRHVEEMLPRIDDEYDREYYAGIACERWAKTQMEKNSPGYVSFDWFVKAMKRYDKADAMSDSGNEEAKLRWNACARIIRRHDDVGPRPEDKLDEHFQDDVPVH